MAKLLNFKPKGNPECKQLFEINNHLPEPDESNISNERSKNKGTLLSALVGLFDLMIHQEISNVFSQPGSFFL